MKYSQEEIAVLWVKNGGDSDTAIVASQVAMAESGGNSLATNRNSNGTTDRGLFQINSIHGGLSVYPVNANVKAAIKISQNGKDWSPWTTYNSGAYRKYSDIDAGKLKDALKKALGWDTGLDAYVPDVSAPIDAVKDAAKVPAALMEATTKLISWTFEGDNWIRVGKIAAGGAMIWAGSAFVLKTVGTSELANIVKAAK